MSHRPRATLELNADLVDRSRRVGARLRPPQAWFQKPTWLPGGERLKIVDSGPEAGRLAGYFYVHGGKFLSSDDKRYAITWSRSGYEALFHRGELVTAEGDVIRVGVITGRGHRPDRCDPEDQVAVVRAADDQHGGYVTGSLVPDATVVDVAMLRRSGLSGEWDLTDDGAEMKALVAVSSPAAVLHRARRGYPARFDPFDVDRVRRDEREYRRLYREVLDEHPPVVAVEMLRHLFNDLDDRDLRERVAALPAAAPLPPPLARDDVPSIPKEERT
jgi:hypothetical protein